MELVRKSRDQLSAYRIRNTIMPTAFNSSLSPRKSTYIPKKSDDHSFKHLKTTKNDSFASQNDDISKDINSKSFFSNLPKGKIIERRRKTIIGKTQALQSLISQFRDNQKDLDEFKEKHFKSFNLNETDLYQQAIEDTCGIEYKTYKNDTKKNLVIEKFRVGNYRRKKMKKIFIFHNN